MRSILFPTGPKTLRLKTDDFSHSFCICALLSCLALLPFSPLMTFWLCVISLSVLSPFLSDNHRRTIGLMAILSGALIAGSRLLFYRTVGFGDDMFSYYPAFELIYHSGDAFAATYDRGYPEILLSLYYWALGIAFGRLSPSGLVFFSSLLTSFLFWIWLEAYAIQIFPTQDRAFCLALTLIFLDFVGASHLVRQMISVPLALLAVSTKSTLLRYIFLALSILAHAMGLPTFFIFWMLLNEKRLKTIGYILLGSALLFLIVSARDFLGTFQHLPILSLFYYLSTIGDAAVVLGGRTQILLSVTSSFLLLCIEQQTPERQKWSNLLIAFSIIYISFAFLGIFRVALPYTAFLLGYAVFFALYKFPRKIPILLLLALAILHITRRGFFSVLETGLAPWITYGPVGIEPFYYLSYFW